MISYPFTTFLYRNPFILYSQLHLGNIMTEQTQFQQSQGQNQPQQNQSPSQIPPPPPPPPAQPPQYHQAYQSVSHLPPPPSQPIHKSNFIETFLDSKLVFILLLTSMLLVAVGGVLVHTAPNMTNYANENPSIEKQREDLKTQNSMIYTGNALADLGAALVASILIVVGLFRKDLTDNARFGLLFAAGFAILALVIRI